MSTQLNPHFLQPVVPDLASNFSIPANFVKYLEGEGCHEVQLRRSMRRRRHWVVRTVGRRMLEGWEAFVRENELHVGQFLVFRYDGDMVFDVTVLVPAECERENELPVDESHAALNQDSGTPDLEENAGIARRRGPYSSRRVGTDCFVGWMRPSYMRHLYFPISFVLEHELLRTNTGILIKDDNGKTWPIRLCIRRDSNVVYTNKCDWISFVKENMIMEGDEFEVRIISKGIKPTLAFHRIEVKLTPQMSDSDCGNVQDVKRNYEPEVVPEPLKRHKSNKVLIVPDLTVEEVSMPANKPLVKEVPEPKAECQEMPALGSTRAHKDDLTPITNHFNKKPNSPGAGSWTHFCQISTWASINRSRMNVNIGFARANNLPNKCGNIILKNQKGESWPAKLIYQKVRTQDCYYIGAGWKEFALSNGLGVGCRFKMEIEEPESKMVTMKLCGQL